MTTSPQSPPAYLSCAYQDDQGFCSHPERFSRSCVDGGCFQGLTHPWKKGYVIVKEK